MKKLLLSLITLLLSIVTFSQTSFKRIYPCPYGEFGNYLIKTIDNGYFIVGNYSAYGSVPPHLMKVDEFGNLQWSASLPLKPNYVEGVLQENDGSFLIIGANVLLKLDISGNILWQYQYSLVQNSFVFHKVKKDIRGDGYVIATIVDEGLALIKVNNSGAVVWTQTMSVDNGGYPLDIVQSAKDSSFYVAGWGIVQGKWVALVSKFEKNGAGVWGKAVLFMPYTLVSYGVSIRETYQGNFIVGIDSGNQLALAQIDTNGTLVSTVQKLTYPFKCMWFWDLASPQENNSFVFSVFKEPYVIHPLSRHPIIGKINGSGGINWVKELGVKNDEYPYCMVNNGSSITLLTTYHDSTAQKSYIKLIKSDDSENFCDEHHFEYPSISYSKDTSLKLICKFKYKNTDRTVNNSSTQFLNETSYEACYETTIENVDVVNIYPNPFNVSMTIGFQDIQYNVIIKIVDVLGKQIQEIPFTGKQLVLQRGQLPNGIYFIHIISGNKKTLTRKIVVQ